jgi:hypothetical protein
LRVTVRTLILAGCPHLKLDPVYEATAVPEPARAIVAGAKGRGKIR